MALGLNEAILGGGLVVIGLTVFAESGLLIGFFLPGDTLLFGAGILASQGIFPISWLVTVIVIAAIIGDNVGYSIGRRLGPRLFKKQDGVIFKQEYVARAHDFYEKHGGKTIILARFVPIVRTFAPVVAGVSKMPRKRFVMFNVIGAVIWGAGVTLLGYYVGSRIPGIERFIEPVILAVVLLSISPALIHIARDPRIRGAIVAKVKRALRFVFLNKRVD